MSRAMRVVLIVGSLWIAAGCQVTDRQVISQADNFNTALEPAVIPDRQLNDYINAVGRRIVRAAEEAHAQRIGPRAHFADDAGWMFSRDMQFHLVNSPTLNAFTTGGEHMYVYTKLLQTCQTEEELAAVMAHEYAHVYSRHVQKGTQRNYAVLGAALAAGAAGYFAGGEERGAQYGGTSAGVVGLAGKLIGSNYTRKDESEADYYGQIFYTRAGWDPRRFGDFFEKMARIEQQEAHKSGGSRPPAFLSDHPPLEERDRAADQASADLMREYERYRRAPIADDAQFRMLQDRAREVGRNMPTDKSLEKASTLLEALPRSCLTRVVSEDQVQAQRRLERMVEERSSRR